MKKLKMCFIIYFALLFLISCTPNSENYWEEKFEENSENVYKEAIYNFTWSMYDNKPYLRKNNGAGGDSAIITFADIDFDEKPEIMITIIYSDWLIPKTEVFKFTKTELKSIGGFYGLINFTGDRYYDEKNIDDIIYYYLNENNEATVIRDIKTFAGGETSITSLINLSTLKNQPLLSKYENAAHVEYHKYSCAEKVFYDELQFAENGTMINEDEYILSYKKLTENLESDRKIKLYTSISFQMNGSVNNSEKHSKEDLFQDSIGNFYYKNSFLAEQIYDDYLVFLEKIEES